MTHDRPRAHCAGSAGAAGAADPPGTGTATSGFSLAPAPRPAHGADRDDRAHRDRAGLPARLAVPDELPHGGGLRSRQPVRAARVVHARQLRRAFGTGNLWLNILNSII